LGARGLKKKGEGKTLLKRVSLSGGFIMSGFVSKKEAPNSWGVCEPHCLLGWKGGGENLRGKICLDRPCSRTLNHLIIAEK